MRKSRSERELENLEFKVAQLEMVKKEFELFLNLVLLEKPGQTWIIHGKDVRGLKPQAIVSIKDDKADTLTVRFLEQKLILPS